MNLLTQALRGERKRRTPYEIMVQNYDTFMAKRPQIEDLLHNVMYHTFRAMSDDMDNLYPERTFMFSPEDTIHGKLVVAKERDWNTRITMEFLQDLKCIAGLDVEQELGKLIATELAIESQANIENGIQISQALYGHNGWFHCPYVTVFPTRETSPFKGVPYIGLHSVVGYVLRE